jgi:hypothetical protein
MKSIAPLALLILTLPGGCGPSGSAPESAAEVEQRALAAQTAQHRTGAELQDHAMNRVIRAVYLCDNGERLTVDFDNPRAMATVRNSHGEAADLFQERSADGIWYRAGQTELRGKGILATWSSDGLPDTQCRAID